MKSIGFVGKIDKTELVEYVAKVLATMGKKVMFIDATSNQKTRYTVPVIDGTESQSQYIVQHDGVEMAIGFNNILELKKYLLGKGENFNEFDYVLIDTDVEEMCEEYDFKSANNLFFITSNDKLYISKGIELLKYICATKRKEDPEGKVDLYKVLFFAHLNSADDNYIQRLTDNLPLSWNEKVINLPLDDGDASVNIQNQYLSKISFRYLTASYKAGIIDMTSIISEEPINNIKKVVKSIEKNARFSI